MKRSGYARCAALGLICILLSGCGETFPTLTQEEYDLIVDYSAGVLSKYSTGNGDKLTLLAPPQEESEEEPIQAPQAAVAEASVKPVAEPVEPAAPEMPDVSPEEPAQEEMSSPDTASTEEPAAQEPETQGAPAQEPAAPENDDAGGESEAKAEASAQAAMDIGRNDLLQQLQDGISVAFNGYYVMNTYPDSSVGGSVLSAENGSKLLILSFSMKNDTGSAENVDILHSNPTFTLLLNGEPVSKNLVTVLDNDMSTYMGTIGAGETTGAVLCFQVKEAKAKSIDTLNLKVNLRGEEQVLKIE